MMAATFSQRWTTMTSMTRHLILATALCSALLATAGPAWVAHGPAPASDADAPHAPVLANPGFECSQGYSPQPGINGLVPNGWTAVLLDGRPELNSTRINFAGSCGGSGFIERIEGEDSMVLLSEDIETPPLPGKPFDAVVYQQTAVMPGVAYSLSAWMVSLCGGSAIPNDCPPGVYMAKMLGIDPTGGVDPLAPSVVWIEDRRNFTESRWANLRLAATAQSSTMTVLPASAAPSAGTARTPLSTPSAWCRRRRRAFVNLPGSVQGTQVTVRWEGSLGPDIPAIPGGTHQLLFDVQQRPAGQAAWSDWQVGAAGWPGCLQRRRLPGHADDRVPPARPRRAARRQQRRLAQPPLPRRLEPAGQRDLQNPAPARRAPTCRWCRFGSTLAGSDGSDASPNHPSPCHPITKEVPHGHRHHDRRPGRPQLAPLAAHRPGRRGIGLCRAVPLGPLHQRRPARQGLRWSCGCRWPGWPATPSASSSARW